MNPKILEFEGTNLFQCPVCKSIIMLDWDKENHEISYPSNCECGASLIWDKKLKDILPPIEEKTPVSFYKTNYFTRRKSHNETNS